MISTKEFIQSKPLLPKFIVKSKIFNSIHKIDKVFPRIGLPNIKEECVLEDSFIVNDLAQQIKLQILEMLGTYAFSGPEFSAIKDLITPSASECVYNNEKMVIRLTRDIYDANKNLLFRKNESLFKVYNKIYKKFKNSFNLAPLEEFQTFKLFSLNNIKEKTKIVFSSADVEGLWDIATMSMRGFSSCQKWSGKYKNRLIGSIVDPFVGVIYLTSDKIINGLGSKMIKRCVVRFIVGKYSKKPIIFIDKMYPSFDERVMNEFRKFLNKHLGNKFEVKDYNQSLNENWYYVPRSDIHSKLPNNFRSYMDFPMYYKYNMLLDEKGTKDNLKLNKYKKVFTEAIYLSDIKEPFLKYSLVDYGDKLVELSNDDDKSVKQLCFHFLVNKDLFYKKAISHFVRSLNKEFKKNNKPKINSKQLKKMLEPLHSNIESCLKKNYSKFN